MVEKGGLKEYRVAVSNLYVYATRGCTRPRFDSFVVRRTRGGNTQRELYLDNNKTIFVLGLTLDQRNACVYDHR